MQTRQSIILPLIVAALGWLAVATLGGLLTDIGPWYRALVKPSWQPPDWLFGPVWTTIFALCSVSAALAWQAADRAARRVVVTLFFVNAVLNVLWSFLFFYLKRPLFAGIEVIALWASILVLIFYVRRISAAAAWLLVPYLVWVSFAAVLNWTVVHLN